MPESGHNTMSTQYLDIQYIPTHPFQVSTCDSFFPQLHIRDGKHLLFWNSPYLAVIQLIVLPEKWNRHVMSPLLCSNPLSLQRENTLCAHLCAQYMPGIVFTVY